MATSGSMANLVKNFRGEDLVKVNDVYWHVQTGQVYQYQGASDVTNTATSITFTELTDTTNGGFLSADALVVPSGNDRLEISASNIKIFNNNVLRVHLGDLS